MKDRNEQEERKSGQEVDEMFSEVLVTEHRLIQMCHITFFLL